MSEILKGLKKIRARNPEIHKDLFDQEIASLDPAAEVDAQILPPLFRTYLASCDHYQVVDGLESFSSEVIEENIIEKRLVVFGFGTKGILGIFVDGDGDSDDLENVKGIEIFGKFDLGSIAFPATPFCQIRLFDVNEGAIVLGDVCMTFSEDDIFSALLTINGLEGIVYNSVH